METPLIALPPQYSGLWAQTAKDIYISLLENFPISFDMEEDKSEEKAMKVATRQADEILHAAFMRMDRNFDGTFYDAENRKLQPPPQEQQKQGPSGIISQ